MTIPILLTTFLLSSCVTVAVSPEGSRVRLTSNADVVRGCKYIGQVKGSDRMNGGLAGQGAAEENAMRDVRNKAAELGANTVHLLTVSGRFSGADVRGEGYNCP